MISLDLIPTVHADGSRVAYLHRARDVRVKQRVSGEQTLTFELAPDDPKLEQVNHELHVHLEDVIYRIRGIAEIREDHRRAVEVFCEALWYDLDTDALLLEVQEDEITASGLLDIALEGTDWTAGTVAATSQEAVEFERLSPLRLVREIEELWNLEASFDTQTNTVTLASPPAADSPASVWFVAGKNIRKIERVRDTRPLITRLYPFGAAGLTVGPANNGIDYLEDDSWFTDQGLTPEVRVGQWTDTRISNPFLLKDEAERRLAIWSRPQVTYDADITDLSYLDARWEGEEISLGMIVGVRDPELAIDFLARVMSREHYPQEPERSRVEIETQAPTLGDLQDSDRLQGREDAIVGAIAGLGVHNLLLNSRGDFGDAYWTNEGFTQVPEGRSGDVAWRATGEAGVRKTLSQTVEAATRDYYTVSFEVAAEDLDRIEGTEVGVRLEIRYADGSTQTRFFPI